MCGGCCKCCSSRKDREMNQGGIPVREATFTSSSGDGGKVNNTSGQGCTGTQTSSIIDVKTSTDATVAVVTSTSFDWDELYEDNGVEQNNPDESKQSVISFLWSQLRVGMDLTKITLPTYILERRSLLEMYADFFAHPDMFLAIAEAPSPSQRMVAVVRWYLAAFHAGRKSDVAKKPYNPILGEVFSCWWNCVGGPRGSRNSRSSQNQDISTAFTAQNSDISSSSSATKAVPKFNKNVINDSNRVFFGTDGSFLPWCYDSKNTLIYFGEQVSHHPPVSAFYAEHAGKNISVSGYIWTKSKFLGLSVAVYNIGEATVCVTTKMGSKEEYILGFPSGYARSVLSVPWIELGGQIEITCAQTGYRGAVEFCTKTMLGRDRNRVISKLYGPGEKKPYMVIDGLWNDVLSLKVPENKERYLDVKALRIWKKETRRIVDQELFESRRLWKDVTKALKYNDVDGASKAKAAVEERQRVEAKEREDGSSNWHPRMFEKSGDKWNFVQSLDKRSAS